jgi:hypothetical protein
LSLIVAIAWQRSTKKEKNIYSADTFISHPCPKQLKSRLISDYSSIQLSHATWHQISACSWETPCASSCKISIPLCRDWDHREHMKFDIISSVTLLPNSLRGYQWFQGLWNLTIRNLQVSSCAKLYRCFSNFLCNPEHSCA